MDEDRTSKVEVDIYDLDARTLTIVSAEGPQAALVAAVLAYSPLFVGAAFLPKDECATFLADVLKSEAKPPGTSREKEPRKAVVVEFMGTSTVFGPAGVRRISADMRRDEAVHDVFGLKDLQLAEGS